MAEFLQHEDDPSRNTDEGPIPLCPRRYNLSNDPPEWPLFNNFEERETHIRRFLLRQYILRLHPSKPVEKTYRAEPVRDPHDGGCYDEFLAHFIIDLRPPGAVKELHLVDKKGSPGVDRGYEALSPASPFPVDDEFQPQERVRCDRESRAEIASTVHHPRIDEEFPPYTRPAAAGSGYKSAPSARGRPDCEADEERASDHHSGDGEKNPRSSGPVSSLRGSRYAALKARALAELPSADDEESASDNHLGEDEASPDSARPVAKRSEQSTSSEANAVGRPTKVQEGSNIDTTSVAVCSAPSSSTDSEASGEPTKIGKGISELHRMPSHQDESGLNETPLPNDMAMALAQPTPYSDRQDMEAAEGGCELFTPDRAEVTNEPEQALEPPPTPSQGSCRQIDTCATESTLVRARIVADEYNDTETFGQEDRLTSSHRSAYTHGPAERIHLHENMVRFVGEEDYWFRPARGDILITNPSTIAENLRNPYAPSLSYKLKTLQDAPSLTVGPESGRQAQRVSGCLKVWNGLYMRELDEFLQYGDLLLRVGTWKSKELDEGLDNRWSRDEHIYSPYYRVDLYSVRRLRPANKYIFLGYQHPLHLQGRAPSCTLESPGKYLNAGAPCPSSFTPALGDIIIQKDAFATNFAHKENFRRSMVKWYKTRTNISELYGFVQQTTEITAGTLLLRPYVGKVETDSESNMDNTRWGGAELYRFETEGWVFWGRNQLLVECGKRLLEDMPILYVADPGRAEDNPNYPSRLILARP